MAQILVSCFQVVLAQSQGRIIVKFTIVEDIIVLLFDRSIISIVAKGDSVACGGQSAQPSQKIFVLQSTPYYHMECSSKVNIPHEGFLLSFIGLLRY